MTKTRKPKAKANEWKTKFLAALCKCGNVTDACKSARIERTAAYHARDEDADFNQAWKDACEVAADSLEKEAWRRAKQGVDEPIVYQGAISTDEEGKPVCVRKYSDALLMFLLKGNRPEKYRERMEHSGPGGTPLSPATVTVFIPDNGRSHSDSDPAPTGSPDPIPG